MVTVKFTENLQRHVDSSPLIVEGETLREVLKAAFVQRPEMRSYVVDDQFALRKHMNIFINQELIKDRIQQTDRVSDGSEIFVMQALSGG